MGVSLLYLAIESFRNRNSRQTINFSVPYKPISKYLKHRSKVSY
jgi:hypothetical protein